LEARARECPHVFARARASAAAPRTTGRAASKPGRARPPLCASPGPEAAHTSYMFDTDAVFHAPMFALNAVAEANA
jgi:hypothetical protein